MDLGNKQLISNQEETQLLDALKQFESATGVDLAIVIAKQSDPYPAARWRLSFLLSWFALLFVTVFWEFHPQALLPFVFLIFLIPFFILTNIPTLLSLGLIDEEKEREVREKSLEEFLIIQSEIPGKPLCLLYLSLLERRAELVFSVDLKQTLGQEMSSKILNETMAQFKKKNYVKGLIELGQHLAQHIPVLDNNKNNCLHLPNKILYR